MENQWTQAFSVTSISVVLEDIIANWKSSVKMHLGAPIMCNNFLQTAIEKKSTETWKFKALLPTFRSVTSHFPSLRNTHLKCANWKGSAVYTALFSRWQLLCFYHWAQHQEGDHFQNSKHFDMAVSIGRLHSAGIHRKTHEHFRQWGQV